MASEIKVDTISEKTSAGGVTIDGLLIKDGNISGDVALAGTTPTFTIGDAGAEDATLVFDGNAQDFYIGLDDSADDLVIGLGSTVGTTPAISINEDRDVTISDGAIDFDIASHDTSNGLKLGGTLVTATAAELNIMDGVTATAAEINLIDGGTSRGTTAVASGDGILINDGGTMAMTNVDTVSTYFASHSVGGGNIVTTGALNSGSITSGFGTIDTGSSTITTTGLISGGSLDIDNVLINGTTIGHTDDTDLITLADGVATIAGELDATTLDISGNADIDGTTNLDAVDIDGAVQIDATVTVGVNDTGYDVKLFGATASKYMLWDESADSLIVKDIVDAVNFKVNGGQGSDGQVLTSTGSGVAWEAVAAGGDLSFGGDTFGADKTVGANDGYAFSLETNGNVAIKMDASGHVTHPLTSCFGTSAATAGSNVTGQGSEHTLKADTERFDLNADYNTGNYTFTAPVTGKYLLICQAAHKAMHSESPNIFYTRIVTSNHTYNHVYNRAARSVSMEDMDFQNVVIADMDANDTATAVGSSENANNETMDFGTNSWFMGHLLA